MDVTAVEHHHYSPSHDRVFQQQQQQQHPSQHNGHNIPPTTTNGSSLLLHHDHWHSHHHQQQQHSPQRHHAPEATPLPSVPSMEPVLSVKQRLLGLRGCPPPKGYNNNNSSCWTMNQNDNILDEQEIKMLCRMVRPILLEQPMMLELETPMKICGDVHGQYIDLLRILEYGGFPPEANYLFLGDYVDRGKQSIETICLLLIYKILYPNNFFILRGNHECAGINRIYGFYDECKRRYSIKLWKLFSDVFNCLPAAAIISERILCMHGGLSPQLQSLNQITEIERPCDVPDSGLLCDLLWSDPDGTISGWVENDRGVSFVFGPDVLTQFLQDHGLDLLVRAHQVVEDGYEFFAGRKLVTVFSAPNYCGEFDNAGGMMTIDEDLTCSFQILKPCSRSSTTTAVTTRRLRSTKNGVLKNDHNKKQQDSSSKKAALGGNNNNKKHAAVAAAATTRPESADHSNPTPTKT